MRRPVVSRVADGGRHGETEAALRGVPVGNMSGAPVRHEAWMSAGVARSSLISAGMARLRMVLSMTRTSRLRRIRESRDLSLRDAARFSGIDAADLSRIERGLQRLFPLWKKRLAKLYQVEESELR